MYLGAIFIPVLVAALSFVALGIAPFGDQTLLISDAGAYYVKYISYLRGVVSGDHSLFYSFSKGLGGNMINMAPGMIINICFWIFPLFPTDGIHIAYALSYFIYVGICGLTSYILLRYIYGSRPYLIIFSTSYALMGFSVVNNFQYVFFTAPMVLPLLTLGLLMLTDRRTPVLYILSIAYILLTNFQSGFALCMFSVFFFALQIYLRKDAANRIDAPVMIRYIISSLLGGGISAFFWFPSFMSYFGGRADQGGLTDYEYRQNMPFLDMGAKFFTGANSTSQLVDGLPVLFVGILILTLCIMWFIDPGISEIKKRGYGILLGIYFASFFLKPLSTVFHGFTHTNWFNYRYSFVVSLIMILLAVEEFERVDEWEDSLLKKCGVFLLVAVIIIFSKSYDFVDGSDALIDIIILAVAYLGYRIYKKSTERGRLRLLTIWLMICVCFNLYLNSFISTDKIMDWSTTSTDFVTDIYKIEPFVKRVEAEDTSFYRMENDISIGNSPFLYDYNGVSAITSNEKKNVVNGTGKFGPRFYAEMQDLYVKDMPASMEALLGLRYIISENDLAAGKGYVEVLRASDVAVYQNPYALGIAILSNEAISDVDISHEGDIFKIQNIMWRALTGGDRDIYTEEKDVTYTAHNYSDPQPMEKERLDEARSQFENILSEERALSDTGLSSSSSSSSSSGSLGLDTEANEDNSTYVEYEFTADRDGRIYIYSEFEVDPDQGCDHDVLKYAGNYKKGDLVRGNFFYPNVLTTPSFKTLCGGMHICYMDEKVLADYAMELLSRPVSIERAGDDHLMGQVIASEGQRLFWTIPYDEGWKLKIDGQETEIKKTAEIFMSAEVPAGEHKYELTYTPPWFVLALTVSMVMCVLMALFILIERKNRVSSKEPKPEKEC